MRIFINFIMHIISQLFDIFNRETFGKNATAKLVSGVFASGLRCAVRLYFAKTTDE